MQHRMEKIWACIDRHNALPLRRALAAFLCVCMMLSLIVGVLPFSVALEVTYTVPNKLKPIDSSKDSYKDAQGNDVAVDNYAWYVNHTQGEPYYISNGKELQALAYIVNGDAKVIKGIEQDSFYQKTVYLTGSWYDDSQQRNVIDLIGEGGLLYMTGQNSFSYLKCDNAEQETFGWTPIGKDASHFFEGTVSGYAEDTDSDGIKDSVDIYNLCGNLVSGAGSAFGLFGYLGPNAKVEGIRLVDSQCYVAGNSTTTAVGMIAGYVTSGAQILNCSAKGIATGQGALSETTARKTDGAGNPILAKLPNGIDYDQNYYFVPAFTVDCEKSGCSVGGLVGQIVGVPDGYVTPAVQSFALDPTVPEESQTEDDITGFDLPQQNETESEPQTQTEQTDITDDGVSSSTTDDSTALPTETEDTTDPQSTVQTETENIGDTADTAQTENVTSQSTVQEPTEETETSLTEQREVEDSSLANGDDETQPDELSLPVTQETDSLEAQPYVLTEGELPTVSNCSFSGILQSVVGYNFLGGNFGNPIKKDGAGGIVGAVLTDALLRDLKIGGIDGDTSLRLNLCGINGGGIVGFAGGAIDVTIDRIGCLENMNGVSISSYSSSATGNNASYAMVGGVMGTSFVTGAMTISNVGENATFQVQMNGKVSPCSGSDTKYAGGFGGVIGFTANRSLTNVVTSGTVDTISNANVRLTAQISGDNNNYYLGGILGRGMYSGNSAAGQNTTLIVENCTVSDSQFTKDPNVVSTAYRLAMGGIIGALNMDNNNNLNATSYVSGCKVSGFDLSTDGLSGGVIGISRSNDNCGLPLVTQCEVDRVHMYPCTVDPAAERYFKVGGILPQMNDGVISYCTVQDFTATSLSNATSQGPNYTWVGGIVGRCNNTTISDCVVNAGIAVSATTNPGNTGYVGGIVGFTGTGTNTINNCAAVLEYTFPTHIKNPLNGAEFTLNADYGNVVVGGLVGEASGTTNITGSFASGTLDVSSAQHTSAYQSVVGGLIGNIYGANSVNVTDCFSTASLKSNLQDAQGGLVGLNNGSLTLSNAWFGGNLRDSWGASIINYSAGKVSGTASYNAKTAPNAPSADGTVTAETASDITLTQTSDNPNYAPYLTLCKQSIVSFATEVETVFAVGTGNVSLQAGSYETQVSVTLPTGTATDNTLSMTDARWANVRYTITYQDAAGNSYTMNRNLRLLRAMQGQSGKNGLAGTEYILSADADIGYMQEYVALGGGFLGAKFTLNASIFVSDTVLSSAIGMAQSNLMDAQENNQPFCGTFDGGSTNDHTICIRSLGSASNPFNGLFGYAQNAAFSNISIEYDSANQVSVSTSGSNISAGGLVGYAAYCTIDNVNVLAARTESAGIASNAGSFGGIVGTAINTPMNYVNMAVASGFHGSMHGVNNVGGIAGRYFRSDKSFTIDATGTGSAATPNINNHNNSVSAFSVYPFIGVQNVYSAGDITAGDATVSVQNCGGMIGYLSAGAGSVKNSFSYGNVRGNLFVGGIVGQVDKLDAGQNTQIQQCYMSGDVYAENYAGGITGYIGTTDESYLLCTNCYFVGQINCNNVYGAMTSSTASAADSHFYYDKQVAGDIGVYGNGNYDGEAADTGNELRKEVFPNFSMNQSGYVKANEVYAKDFLNGTTLNDSNTLTEAGGSTMTFSPSIVASTSTTADNSKWFLSYNTADPTKDRFLTQVNSASSNSYSVQIQFSGTDFALFDYISGSGGKYNIQIDDVDVGVPSTGNKYTAGFSDTTLFPTDIFPLRPAIGMDWYKITLANGTTVYTTYKSGQTPDASAWPTSSTGVSTYDGKNNTLYVTGLTNGAHTITLTADKSTSNDKKYITFFGYVYWQSKEAQDNNRNNSADYPEILTFQNMQSNARAKALSAASVRRLYDFTDNESNTATCFKIDPTLETPNTITEAEETVSYSHEIPQTLGVTYADKVYSPPTMGQSGSFTITTTDSALAYPVSVIERIYVVPFVDGDGSKTNPFRIPDVKTLLQFRTYINEVFHGAGQYFELCMNTEEAAEDSGDDGYFDYDLTRISDDEMQNTDDLWTQGIGTEEQPFAGHFNGNDCRITNLKIKETEDQTTLAKGLFDYTAGADISRLSVAGSINLTGQTSSYTGLICGVAMDSSFTNVSADADITVSSPANGKLLSAGGLVGALMGDSTLQNCLTWGDVIVSSAAQNSAVYAGGLVGLALTSKSLTEDKGNLVTIEISNCVSNTNVSALDATSPSQVGGLLGRADMQATGALNISSCAAFASALNATGNTGSAIGKADGKSGTSLTVNNVNSTMYLQQSPIIDTAESHLGGIIGSLNNTNVTTTLTGCTFGGELLSTQKTSKCSEGGVVGYVTRQDALNDAQNTNVYDVSVNYSVGDIGSSSKKIYAKNTYEIVGTAGVYPGVSVDTATIGSASDSAISAAIVLGNTIAMNVVRTNVVDCGDLFAAIAASSVYVLDYPQTSDGYGATVEKVYEQTVKEVQSSISHRRMISNATNDNALVRVKIQMSKDGADALLGYGKEMTYSPSIRSTGRTDSSYMIADPDGDGVEAASASFTIYNEDQLMGLDPVIEGATNDGVGGILLTAIDDSAYTFYLNNDICFGDTANYMDSGAYRSMIIGSEDKPFHGTLDGKGNGSTSHIICDRLLSSAEKSVGLFAKADGAHFSNIGFSDSVIHQIGAPYLITATQRTDYAEGSSYYYKDSNNGYDPVTVTSGDFAAVLKAYGKLYTLAPIQVETPVSGTAYYFYSPFNGAYVLQTYTNGRVMVGCIAGSTTDVTVENCFSSVRVEQDNPVMSDPLKMGGFFGETTGNVIIASSAFTGSVGIAAQSSSSYPGYHTQAEAQCGGFVGNAVGELTVKNGSYVAAYVLGPMEENNQDVGHFAGRSNSGVTVMGCSVDYIAGNECPMIGNRTELSASSLSADENGLYPAVGSFDEKDDRVKLSRIAVNYSSAAYSMSEANVTFANAVFSHDSYLGALSVYQGSNGDKYLISDDNRTLTRNNDGTSSVLLRYGTSSRLLTMNLKCWYDNYQTVDGHKIYTIKNAAELLEFSRMVNAMSFDAFLNSEQFQTGTDAPDDQTQYNAYIASLIGHGHSNNTVNSATSENAANAFASATIQMGADITLGTDVAMLPAIGENRPFAGTFDGNGYRFTFVEQIDTATERPIPIIQSDGSSVGLFGTLGATGKLQNIITDGALAISSTITTGNVTIGGIVGENQGTVKSCANGAALQIQSNGANVKVGGIAGTNGEGVTLTDCYNMGHISGNATTVAVSGIAGQNQGTITYSYNTGILEGSISGSPVYGITAENAGTVQYCYNAGVLMDTDGINYAPIAPGGTVLDCLFDWQVYVSNFNSSTAYSGVTANTTLQMTSQPMLGDSNKWTYVQNGNYYPQLTGFATGSDLARASSLASTLGALLRDRGEDGSFDGFSKITFAPGGESVIPSFQSGMSNGTFAFTNNGTQTIGSVDKKGTAFFHLIAQTPAGDTIYREAYYINEAYFTVRYMIDYGFLTQDKTEATLRTAPDTSIRYWTSNGSQILPGANNGGTGKANAPYLINNKEDLYAFASYVNNGGDTVGVNFKLTNNITADDAFVPIGTATHPFYGVFNGNGYTISGISYKGTPGYIGLFGYAGENSVIEYVALADDCLFTYTNSGSTDTYIGALAGYTAGLVTNCYSRAVVAPGNLADGTTLCAGALVGKIAKGAILSECYVRPKGQIISETGATLPAPEVNNNFRSTVTNANMNFYGGILAGWNEGTVNGCYHTCVYLEPTGVTGLLPHGILVGWNRGATVKNTFYNTTAISDPHSVFVYTNTGTTADAASADASDASIADYGMTSSEMLQSESAASSYHTEEGRYVKNDSMALLLSRDSYLGAYEMSLLPTAEGITNPLSANGNNSNDGLPVLSVFDFLQFQFNSFDSSNLILNLQNIDASAANAKILNALCSYEDFNYPIFASFIAKSKIKTQIFSLPNNISYNISAVAYGYDDDGNDIKWVAYNGLYTGTHGLTGSLPGEVNNNSSLAGHNQMVQNMESGATSIVTASAEGQVLPNNCDLIYIYIVLNKETEGIKRPWGVYHDWDSAYLDEEMYDEEV